MANYSIPAKLCTALLNSGTAAVYTAGAGHRTRITAAAICNDSASDITVDVYLVPSGGSANATTQIRKDMAIPAGATMTLYELLNQVVEPSGAIHMVPSTNDVASAHVSGTRFYINF